MLCRDADLRVLCHDPGPALIGIVVVSHSRALATAAVGLAGEMVDKEHLPSISVAAGLDETTFGTDAAAVAEAITAADTPDGVLVLLDLGSAVLSAEMALEFVDPDLAARVVISSAPLVEGLVAAVVTAASGASLDEVVAEAVRGLAGKQDHLGDAPSALNETADAVAPSAAAAPPDEQTVEVEVRNSHGLHARPAAKLVGLVRSFDASVLATNVASGKGPVDAASLSLVATLNVRQGDRLRLAASGPQASEVLAAVAELAEQGFGEELVSSPTAPASPTSSTAGSGLDIALGPAVVPTVDVDTSGYVSGSVDDELAAAEAAVSTAAAQLEQVRETAALRVGPEEADIFTAQLAILHDPSLDEAATHSIRAGGTGVDAWGSALDEVAGRFEQLDDPYQRARAQDIRSIKRLVLSALMGVPLGTAEEESAGILVVPEIDAATAATLDTDKITGVATAVGGATGHGVIVARSRGIPTITDVGEAATAVRTGSLVAFDCRTGEFIVDPDAEQQRRYAAAIAGRADERRAAVVVATEPAVMSDGHQVAVLANVASVADAEEAARSGADGAGLVRTEVLFGHLSTAPTVEEQAEVFAAVADALGGAPITIRTWDIGGDKPVPFLRPDVEANPFLGERGLRLSRRFPDLFADQLRAICLVARHTPVRVMFPMVTTAAEVRWAREQLSKAAADVGLANPSGLGVGIMVEVPAAALSVARLAVGLDFVSIGTNDLAQYTMAADRGNTAVAGLADGLEPALLGLIAAVCAQAPSGTEVAVCGDLASRPELSALLVGLGVGELSAVGPAVPLVKAALRRASLADAQELGRAALACDGAADVRAILPRS